MTTERIDAYFKPEDLQWMRSVFNGSDKGAQMLRRALNYGANQGRKITIDEIYAKLNVKRGTVKNHVFFPRSLDNGYISARLVVTGFPLPLEEFNVRNLAKGGVSFKIWRNGDREKYRHVFYYKGRVVERNIDSPAYDGRTPFRSKSGPSIPNVFANTPGLADRAIGTATDRTLTELERLTSLMLEGRL
ncbi:hypothetical protein KQ940_11195 [Marinobacterium sp. D7]|uniref:hypothetical protein n=1 Tax=Marinobacterium ramblicola TaxID=2849041 RepID=UPI001C2CD4B8|nr:hypothetical protein [Marinobacterium ramblicola]MBV1788619.1 hypothetical protein [Marinobacterium ramblicola]